LSRAINFGDSLGPHGGPPLGGVDPSQVARPVELGEGVEERPGLGVGVEGGDQIGGQLNALGALGGDDKLNLVARCDPGEPAGTERETPPGVVPGDGRTRTLFPGSWSSLVV
jgi:hypothetical protein